MPGDPHSGSKVWKAADREIGKSGKNRRQIVAHREFQPPAAFHDRENRRNLRSRLWAADVQPILSTKSYRTHGVLRQVSTYLYFGILQEAGELLPKPERVLASFAECAGGQCNGLRYLDLAADIIEKRSRRSEEHTSE